jgi:N-acylneuraminate cytidylyltransferase
VTIVAIIPARGGSKGIPKKNIAPLAGRPLIAHTILQARAVSEITRVLVSTDDRDIAEVAHDHGAIPVRRPDDISGDFSPSEDAIKHVLSRENPLPEIVVMLQATSPIRRPSDIKRAIQMVRDEGYDSVLSVVPQHQFLWQDNGEGAYPLNYQPVGYRPMRQSVRHYVENGSIYCFKTEVLQRYGTRLGGKMGVLEMPYWSRFEIDQPDDLDICEWVFGREDLY